LTLGGGEKTTMHANVLKIRSMLKIDVDPRMTCTSWSPYQQANGHQQTRVDILDHGLGHEYNVYLFISGLFDQNTLRRG